LGRDARLVERAESARQGPRARRLSWSASHARCLLRSPPRRPTAADPDRRHARVRSPDRSPPRAGSDPMSVLVTGANGFLGRAGGAAAVDAGHEVVALVRPAASLRGAPWSDER